MQILESIKKGSNRELEGTAGRTSRFFTIRSTIGWSVAIIATYLAAKKLDKKIVTIRLDDFLQDPVAVCTEYLGIDVENIPELTANHGIAGNRTRRGSGKITMKATIEQPIAESFFDRALTGYMSMLTSRLGLEPK